MHNFTLRGSALRTPPGIQGCAAMWGFYTTDFVNWFHQWAQVLLFLPTPQLPDRNLMNVRQCSGESDQREDDAQRHTEHFSCRAAPDTLLFWKHNTHFFYMTFNRYICRLVCEKEKIEFLYLALKWLPKGFFPLSFRLLFFAIFTFHSTPQTPQTDVASNRKPLESAAHAPEFAFLVRNRIGSVRCPTPR